MINVQPSSQEGIGWWIDPVRGSKRYFGGIQGLLDGTVRWQCNGMIDIICSHIDGDIRRLHLVCASNQEGQG